MSLCDWDQHNIVRLAIPFITGMTVAHFLYPHLVLPLVPLIAGAAACAFVMALGLRWPLAQGVAVHAFCLLLGLLLFQMAAARVEQSVPTATTLRAAVADSPQAKPRSYAVYLQPQGGNRLLVYLQKDDRAARLQPGDSVELRRVSWQSTSPRDSLAGYFDSYLFHHGVAARAYARASQWILLSQASDTASADFSFAALRRRALHLYTRMGIGGDGGAVVEAMTLGEKSHLTAAQRDAFSASGLSHLLALSGFHLSILLTLFNVLLLRSRLPWGSRRAMGLLVIPTLWAFAALTGFAPSLVRAVVMCSVLQVVFLLGHDYNMLNALALAAVAMLAVQPLTLLDVGFQLSFLSMLGIGLVAVPLMRLLPRRLPWGVRPLADTLLVSLACTLATLPLVAYYFGRVPLLSLLSNVAAALLATALMWAAVAWWLLTFWPAAQSLVSVVLLFLARALQAVATAFGTLPAATLTLHPTVLQVALCYVLLGGAVHFLHHRRARALMVSLAALVALEATALF